MAIDSVPHDGLEPENKPELVTQSQSLVGSFNWLAGSTRPDIAAVTSLLGSHLRNPSAGHLDAAKHVARCLKGTPTWGIRFTQPRESERFEGVETPLTLKGA